MTSPVQSRTPSPFEVIEIKPVPTPDTSTTTFAGLDVSVEDPEHLLPGLIPVPQDVPPLQLSSSDRHCEVIPKKIKQLSVDTSELSVEAAVEEAGSQFKKDLPENLDILQDAFSYKALNLYQDCDTKYAEDEKHYPYLHAIKIKGAPLQKEEGSVWGLFKETLRGGVFGNNLNHHFPGIPMPTREFIMLLASREYLTGALRALTPAISNQIEMIKPGIEGRVSTSLHVQEILIDGDPTNFHFTIQYQIAYWPKFLYQNKQVAIFRKNPPLLTCKLDVQTQRPVGEKIQFPAQVEIAMEMGELKATPEPVKKSADLDEDLQDSQTKQESPDRQESYYDINFYPL